MAQSLAQSPQPQADNSLSVYNAGREYEMDGRMALANEKYVLAITRANQELNDTPNRMESFVVKAWSLYRLKRYQDVISVGRSALNLFQDFRVVEVMGESYFYLNDDDNCIAYLQRYLDNMPENGDRVSIAYFFMAEAYLRKGKLDHADISYTMAINLAPKTYRWWFKLGVLKEYKKETAQAVYAYERALALKPDYAEALAARTRLKGGQAQPSQP